MRALILSLALASLLPLAASAAEPRSDSVAVAVGVNATVITPHTIAVRHTRLGGVPHGNRHRGSVLRTHGSAGPWPIRGLQLNLEEEPRNTRKRHAVGD